jgi:hypothetical protein
MHDSPLVRAGIVAAGEHGSKKTGPRRRCDEGQVISVENPNCPFLQAFSGSVKQRPFRARLGSQTGHKVASDDKQPASQDRASLTLRYPNNR